MSIKYKIRSIENASGDGKDRHYAHICQDEPMTDRQLEEQIQSVCSLTKGDVKAALSAIRELMVQRLRGGNRFHIPEIGTFSFAVTLDAPDGTPAEKLRGDHIRIRNINFRPDAALLSDASSGVRFEKDTSSGEPKRYSREQLLTAMRTYLQSNRCITSRIMRLEFGLSATSALGWLRRLTADGTLRKEGSRRSPVYFLNE